MPILIWLGSRILGLGRLLKQIPWQFWEAVAVVIILLFLLGQLHRAEKANADLTTKNEALDKKVSTLTKVNADNQKAYDAKLRSAEDARKIAEEERVAAEARATRYRSIRDAAKNTPAVDRRPVGSAVRNTVDRLWDDSQTIDNHPGALPSPNTGPVPPALQDPPF